MNKKLIFLFLCFCAGAAQTQWSNDPTVNTVLDKPGDQRAPLMATDGKGGAIVAWDEDDGVFANWVDKFGFRKWGDDGIRITPVGRIAHLTNITSDGNGGAVIVWNDFTHARDVGYEVSRIIENEMYVQRIDSKGQLLWPEDGVGIRTKIDSTTIGAFNMVTSDYSDFILFWIDDRKHPFPETGPFDFYAEKLDLQGNVLWKTNGQLISVEGSLHDTRYRIVTDGAGGFLLARFGEGSGDTVVERISAGGEMLWRPGGVPVHTGGAFEMTSDGNSGAIVTGVDFPGGGVVQVKTQRINASGELLWPDSLTVVTDGADLDTFPRIVSDGNSGAYIYWDAKDRVGDRKGFLLHLNASALPSGPAIATRYNVTSTIHPILIRDQRGGMILLAIDFFETPQWDFWGVRLGPDGLAWGVDGILFRQRPVNDWPFPFDAIGNGNGGFIAVWDEYINDTTSFDLVIQQVNAKGTLGEVITSIKSATAPETYSLSQNYPNPFNPETTITFALKKSGFVKLRIYNLQGKEVITLANKELPAGKHRVAWNGHDKTGKPVASGIYFYRLSVNGFRAVRKLVFIR